MNASNLFEIEQQIKFRNEGHFQAHIESECNKLALLTAHFISEKVVTSIDGTQKRTGYTRSSGFPDLVIIGKRTIFRELKMPNGRLSERQKFFGERLLASGQDWAVWYANQLSSIMAELKALSW